MSSSLPNAVRDPTGPSAYTHVDWLCNRYRIVVGKAGRLAGSGGCTELSRRALEGGRIVGAGWLRCRVTRQVPRFVAARCVRSFEEGRGIIETAPGRGPSSPISLRLEEVSSDTLECPAWTDARRTFSGAVFCVGESRAGEA